MVFMRPFMTLELSTSIEIDLGISGSKVCGFILHVYVFYDIHIVIEYKLIRCDRFREPMIDLHAPYRSKAWEWSNLEFPTTTKLDLTIPLLSLGYVDIDLNIQYIFLILYMT